MSNINSNSDPKEPIKVTFTDHSHLTRNHLGVTRPIFLGRQRSNVFELIKERMAFIYQTALTKMYQIHNSTNFMLEDWDLPLVLGSLQCKRISCCSNFYKTVSNLLDHAKGPWTYEWWPTLQKFCDEKVSLGIRSLSKPLILFNLFLKSFFILFWYPVSASKIKFSPKFFYLICFYRGEKFWANQSYKIANLFPDNDHTLLTLSDKLCSTALAIKCTLISDV